MATTEHTHKPYSHHGDTFRCAVCAAPTTETGDEPLCEWHREIAPSPVPPQGETRTVAGHVVPAGISDELPVGIQRYADRITALGGYGARIRAQVRGTDRTVREGVLIELGHGGCQPGLRQDDGRRFGIDLDTVDVVKWQPPTDEQADAASSVGWSDAYDPALDDEIDPERIAAHEADGESWDAAIEEALSAATEAEQTDALERAGQIEREWGDDPQTRRVREILGR